MANEIIASRNHVLSSVGTFELDMDNILIPPQAEEKEVECFINGWTDDKHRSYLNLIEAVFIENLYGREYCTVDVCGSRPEHRASRKQILVDNTSITPTDLLSQEKLLGSQNVVLHLQSGRLPGLASSRSTRRFTSDVYDNFTGFRIVGEAREYRDSETLVEENAAREKKTKKSDFLLEVPDIDKEGYLEHVSSENRLIPTGSCSLVFKRQRLQKREVNNISPIKGNGKKLKSQQNLYLPDLEHQYRHTPAYRAKGREIQISAHHRLKQMQKRPPPQRRRNGLRLRSTDDPLEYAKVQKQVRYPKQGSGSAEEIADSDQVVPSSGDDNTQNHDFSGPKLIVPRTTSDRLSSSTVEVTVEQGGCVGSIENTCSQHVTETARNNADNLGGSAEACRGVRVIPQEASTFDPDLEPEMHRSRGETATRHKAAKKWASGILGFRDERANQVKKEREL